MTSRTWRMPVEVKAKPQPYCETPLAALFPMQRGDLDLLGLVRVRGDFVCPLRMAVGGVNMGEVQGSQGGSVW